MRTIRKFKVGDDEKNVMLFLKAVKWYVALLNVILDRYPLEKYVVEEEDE